MFFPPRTQQGSSVGNNAANLSKMPQIYIGGNQPDTGVKTPGFGGIKRPSIPQSRKMLDKARGIGENRPLAAQKVI